MENKYRYIDPENQYTDPSGILHNLANIKDERILLAYESLKVSQRLEELFENPLKIKDSSALLKIHFHLFQDIYAWAGKVRSVNISKDGKPFFDGERFSSAFQYIDSLIEEYRTIDSSNFAEIAKALASILDHVNFLHPFREGKIVIPIVYDRIKDFGPESSVAQKDGKWGIIDKEGKEILPIIYEAEIRFSGAPIANL